MSTKRRKSNKRFFATLSAFSVALLVIHAIHGSTVSKSYFSDPPWEKTLDLQARRVVKTTEPKSRLRSLIPITQRPIVFFHFHKSGGSDVCRTIRYSPILNLTGQNHPHNHPQEQEQRMKGILNCNALFMGPRTDPRKMYSVLDAPLSCAMLLPYTTSPDGVPFQRNNFVGVEMPLNHPYPCRGDWFRNFALMRHPLDRALSHMKVRNWTEEDVFRESQQQRRTTNKSLLPKNEARLMHHVYSCMNNMVIRQILGYDRFVDTTTPITDWDFQQAKEIVDHQFQVFVPTCQQWHPRVLALFQQEIPEYYHALLRQRQQGKAQENSSNVSATAATNNNPIIPTTNYDENDNYNSKETTMTTSSPLEDVDIHYDPSPEFLHHLYELNKYDLLLYEFVHERLGLLPYKDKWKERSLLAPLLPTN